MPDEYGATLRFLLLLFPFWHMFPIYISCLEKILQRHFAVRSRTFCTDFASTWGGGGWMDNEWLFQFWMNLSFNKLAMRKLRALKPLESLFKQAFKHTRSYQYSRHFHRYTLLWIHLEVQMSQQSMQTCAWVHGHPQRKPMLIVLRGDCTCLLCKSASQPGLSVSGLWHTVHIRQVNITLSAAYRNNGWITQTLNCCDCRYAPLACSVTLYVLTTTAFTVTARPTILGTLCRLPPFPSEQLN